MKPVLRRLALTFCCLAFAATAYAQQGAPRFRFHQGETLTYQVHLSGKGTGASAYAVAVDGQVVLTVLKIRPSGVAELELSASGQGALSMSGESTKYEEEPPPRLVLAVKPDGTIIEMRDSKGNKTSLLQAGFVLFNAGVVIRMYAVGSYTMFGLQLPATSVALGGKWMGVHKSERATWHVAKMENLDAAKMKVELESDPVSFTYVGSRDYQGQACMAISCASALGMNMAGSPRNAPGAFCFDNAQGRLMSLDVHRAWGTQTQKVDFDYSVVLAKVTPPGGKAGS